MKKKKTNKQWKSSTKHERANGQAILFASVRDSKTLTYSNLEELATHIYNNNQQQQVLYLFVSHKNCDMYICFGELRSIFFFSFSFFIRLVQRSMSKHCQLSADDSIQINRREQCSNMYIHWFNQHKQMIIYVFLLFFFLFCSRSRIWLRFDSFVAMQKRWMYWNRWTL